MSLVVLGLLGFVMQGARKTAPRVTLPHVLFPVLSQDTTAGAVAGQKGEAAGSSWSASPGIPEAVSLTVAFIFLLSYLESPTIPCVTLVSEGEP